MEKFRIIYLGILNTLKKGFFILFGIVICSSPFIPNILYSWGYADEKVDVTNTDLITVLVGFVFAFGGSYLPKLAKIIGNGIASKINKNGQ